MLWYSKKTVTQRLSPNARAQSHTCSMTLEIMNGAKRMQSQATSAVQIGVWPINSRRKTVVGFVWGA